VSPKRSLALAVGIGLTIGGIVYQFLLRDWFVVRGSAATYARVAYFYLAFDVPLLGEHLRFSDRHDKLGYALGVFGLSTTPLAIIQLAEFRQPEAIGVLVWTTGVIAFLLFAAIAHEQQWTTE